MATWKQIKKIYRNGVEYHIVGSNVYDATVTLKNRKGESINSFTTNQKTNQDITLPIGTLSGSGAPTSVPTEVGQTYLDTATKDLYYAGGTSSKNDWIKLTKSTLGNYIISSNGTVLDIVHLEEDDYQALVDAGTTVATTLYVTPAE